MFNLRVFLAGKCLIFVVFIVEATLVTSVTVPNQAGKGTVCKENCDSSELVGNDHTVVKKEAASKLNSTEAAKVEEDYFDEMFGMLSSGKSNQDTENSIEQRTRGARMLGNWQGSDADEDSSAKNSHEFTPSKFKVHKLVDDIDQLVSCLVHFSCYR